MGATRQTASLDAVELCLLIASCETCVEVEDVEACWYSLEPLACDDSLSAIAPAFLTSVASYGTRGPQD